MVLVDELEAFDGGDGGHRVILFKNVGFIKRGLKSEDIHKFFLVEARIGREMGVVVDSGRGIDPKSFPREGIGLTGLIIHVDTVKDYGASGGIYKSSAENSGEVIVARLEAVKEVLSGFVKFLRSDRRSGLGILARPRFGRDNAVGINGNAFGVASGD